MNIRNNNYFFDLVTLIKRTGQDRTGQDRTGQDRRELISSQHWRDMDMNEVYIVENIATYLSLNGIMVVPE